MNEIKFRYVCYNRETKAHKMFFFTIDEIQTHSDKWMGMCEVIVTKGYEVIFRDLFIGINDKNGREIYERDIVKYDNSIWEVKYDTPFFNLCKKERGLLIGAQSFATCEIIGTVYENPELLN